MVLVMRPHRIWHPHLWLKRLALATGFFAAFLFTFAWSANAGTFTFTDTVPVTLEGSGITLQILGGSIADGVDVQSTTLTVTVLTAESVTIRYPAPAGSLSNNGGLSVCNASSSGNDVTVTGPATVTFTPDSATPCAVASGGGGGGGGGGSTSAPPSVQLATPNGGSTYDEGSQQQIIWSAGGSQVTGIRLSLSTDGGATFPTIIADNEANDGAYLWTVPSTASTAARIRVDVIIVGGVIGATDVSDANFTIAALPATVVPAPTINDDKELETPEPPPDEPPPPPPCIAGTRIKGPLAAVYYCGNDGKRYVFPDQFTYFSWYPDFKGVITVTAEALAATPVGGNVTYKPGSLVKIQTDPKVYVVSKGGLLRWVPDEATAIAYFGPNWSKLVRDVPVVFFLNYVIGSPLAAVQ